MIAELARNAVMYLLPVCVGLAAGLIFDGRLRPWFGRAMVCLGAIAVALPMQYSALLIVYGATTGDWPDAFALVGVLYALAWFSIPAIFTTAPMVVAGYWPATTLRKRSPAAVAESQI